MNNLFPLTPSGKGYTKKDGTRGFTSQPLKWSDAIPMITEYRSNPKKLTKIYKDPATGQPVQKILQGFRIDSADLQDLINRGATEVFISFAVSPKCVGKDPEKQGFTIIVAGVKPTETSGECGELMLDDVEEPVFEYCDPCPPKCPVNLYSEIGASQGDLPCCGNCEYDTPCEDPKTKKA